MANFLTFDNIGDQVENLIDDDDTTIRTIIDQVINNVYRDIMGEFRKGRNIPPWLTGYDDTLATVASARTTKLTPELAPEACCTDPDNNQNNTDGWTAVNATLTSEAEGVTGNKKLKIAATATPGRALSSDFSMIAKNLFRLKCSAGADVGDKYRIIIESGTQGSIYTSGGVAGQGAGIWDTIDESIECPSTQSDWKIKLDAVTNGDNAYFKNISFQKEDMNIERILKVSLDNQPCLPISPEELEGGAKVNKDNASPTYWWGTSESRPTRFYHEKGFSSAGAETNKLLWFPLPDAAYDIRYWFEKQVSILVNAADVPLLPFWAHQALVWGSLVQMPMFDVRVKSGPWDMLYEQVINQLMGFSNNFVIDGSTVPFGL